MTLAGRVVLVTGAARGIGAATARSLARRGARVALVGLEPERLARVAEQVGGAWFEADVTDGPALAAAVRAAAERFGAIDAVVANAGVANYGTVLTADPEEFARTIEVNLVGVYRTVAACAPFLIERRGYALLIASIATFLPLPGAAAYSASKAGVYGMAGALRTELAPHGVAVGTAHPGWIDTDMVRDAERALPSLRDLRAQLPWPLSAAAPVEAAGERLALAVERRSRRVFVPRSVIVVPALRPLMTGRLADLVVRRRARTMIPRVDEEVRALRPERARRRRGA